MCNQPFDTADTRNFVEFVMVVTEMVFRSGYMAWPDGNRDLGRVGPGNSDGETGMSPRAKRGQIRAVEWV